MKLNLACCDDKTMTKRRILLVCKGNICRSAIAERILSSKSGDLLEIKSRGTRSWHEGKGAHPK